MVDEFLALAYWREHGVPTVVVRLFNCVGPRQVGRYGMVVPRFIQQALTGEDLTIYGSGKQARCFCYVSDVVKSLLLLAESEGAVGEVVNIGNPQEVTIEDLAQRVIALTETKVRVSYIPYEKAYEAGFEDMDRRVPDIRKLKELTGFAPEVGLDEALLRTLEWFREQARAAQLAMRAVC
jgi:UDP-glucose 4-epimerase